MPPTDENNFAMMQLDEMIKTIGLRDTLGLINQVVANRRDDANKSIPLCTEAKQAGRILAVFDSWNRVHTKLRHFITELPDAD